MLCACAAACCAGFVVMQSFRNIHTNDDNFSTCYHLKGTTMDLQNGRRYQKKESMQKLHAKYNKTPLEPFFFSFFLAKGAAMCNTI